MPGTNGAARDGRNAAAWPRTTVLLAGNVTLDRVPGGFTPGGTVSYAARTYLGLGARVRAVTAAAADYPSATLAGADVVVVPAARTTTFVNTYDAAGIRTQRVEAIAPPVEPSQAPASWLAADLVHLAPIMGEIALRTWLPAVRGRFVGIGVQGWVRAVAADGTVIQPPWEPAPEELRGVDAACVGEDDLRGQGDLLDRLIAAVPIVAFTHGDRGCEVIVRGRTLRIGAFRTHEVDPTGAGDVFSAGFFLGLAEGADPAQAARLGAAAASIVVEARGADALDRIPEARARVAAVPVLSGSAGAAAPVETRSP
ncbi:PfkB family carbohydrate kinase [Anaeromyxobacter oryzae]|uniref:Ribokinase n=1 Tax=Anaeromyxobacter oryzae TaxID=2918170 RepID=A0ABN6MWW6_9BACT|nr:PfkB family carbohydrate kinase [Anaeromyxobacter oryzae]BDG05391.1 ribokinase [Anaeromyxobacter oryzae]